MKKSNRILSGILTAAMLVTSVWGGYGVTSYAAEPEGQIETGSTEPLEALSGTLLRWSSDGTDERISADGRTYTRDVQNFTDATYRITYVDGSEGNIGNNLEISEDEIKAAFSPDDDAVTIDNYTVGHRWYKEDTVNGRELLEDKDSSTLYYSSSISAGDGNTKFIHEIILESADIDGESHEFSELDGRYSYSVEEIFSYEYTGSPVSIDTPSETTVPARKGSKQTFKVEAEVVNHTMCEGVRYQWYAVKGTDETILEGETTDTLKVKITNYDISYKCVVTGDWKQGYGYTEWESFVVFYTEADPGYRKIGCSERYVYAALNESIQLYVNAEVDDGYSLEYKWEKASRDADTGSAVLVPVGTDKATLDITPESSSDFDVNAYENGEFFNYKLTVSVKNGSQTVDMYSYYFSLSEDTKLQLETNAGSKELHYGEPAELYVRPSADDSYTVKNTWSVRDEENYEYKEIDASVKGVTVSTDTTTLSVEALEQSMKFRCITEVYNKTEPEMCIDYDYNYFTLNVTTELSAYAKNSTVTGSVGQPAILEAVAQNFDEAKRPITYTWKKQDKKTKEYVEINNKTARYNITRVTEDDFGSYQVVVSDGTETIDDIFITLVEEDLELVVYTPEKSYFYEAIGDTVKLIADMRFSADVSVFYEWYKDGWEILGQDGSEYEFELNNEEQYGMYTCIATFKNENVSYSKEFYYYVNPYYTFTYENLVPRTQYKNIGESATYSVRVLTDDPDVQENMLRYCWYRYDGQDGARKEIEGAASSSYTVNKLSAEDFGNIYCEITVEGRDNYGETVRFATYLDSDLEFEENNAVIEAKAGSDVKLSPTLINAGNKTLTYQWSRHRFVNNDDYEWENIIGAVEKDYTISEIGSSEFLMYGCEISWDGIPVGTYYVTVREMEEEETELTVNAEEGCDRIIYAVPGSSVRMAVTAASNKNLRLQYQWYYEDDAIGGATSASYEIRKAASFNEGEYRCEVKDEEDNQRSVTFNVYTTTNLSVETGSMNASDTIGYAASFGKSVTLKASAAIASGYDIFYEWYRCDEDGDLLKRLPGQTASQMTIQNVSEEDLGFYCCRVYSSVANNYDNVNQKYLYYQVYVDTGLVVEPSGYNVLAASDGSVKMSAEAHANAGEKISYQWYKWDSENGEAVEIAGANKSAYTISKLLKKHYGYYFCIVSTRGESHTYNYELLPGYKISTNREYAQKGESVTAKVVIRNQATDAKYSYEWYARDVITGSYMKAAATGASYTAKAPSVSENQLETDYNNRKCGYALASYMCQVKEEEGIYNGSASAKVKVLPLVTYSQNLPETSHPNDKDYSLKGYRSSGAKQLTITFDNKTDMDSVIIIDKNGIANYAGRKPGLTVTINGDSFVILAGSSYDSISGEYGYGYKVASVKKIGTTTNTGTTKPSTPAKKAVPKKGTTYTSGNVVYKVTKSASKNGTVAVSKVKKKSLTSATIKDTVKIGGYTFKVTKVNSSAFKGCTKLKKVTVGKNVTSIGKNAFYGCKSLKTITIKSSGIKTVGKNAFKGINKSAKIKVPAKKLTAYKKTFKGKGQGTKVKITK